MIYSVFYAHISFFRGGFLKLKVLLVRKADGVEIVKSGDFEDAKKAIDTFCLFYPAFFSKIAVYDDSGNVIFTRGFFAP